MHAGSIKVSTVDKLPPIHLGHKLPTFLEFDMDTMRCMVYILVDLHGYT